LQAIVFWLISTLDQIYPQHAGNFAAVTQNF